MPVDKEHLEPEVVSDPDTAIPPSPDKKKDHTSLVAAGAIGTIIGGLVTVLPTYYLSTGHERDKLQECEAEVGQSALNAKRAGDYAEEAANNAKIVNDAAEKTSFAKDVVNYNLLLTSCRGIDKLSQKYPLRDACAIRDEVMDAIYHCSTGLSKLNANEQLSPNPVQHRSFFKKSLANLKNIEAKADKMCR